MSPRPTTVRAGVAALATALLLAACAGEAAFAPSAGDCLRLGEDEPGSSRTQLAIVDCDEPHHLEVFHTFDLGVDEISGDARVEAVAEACLGEAFTEYVGVPEGESPLEVLPLPPTPERVAEGDRTVRCTVRPPGGDTTSGSIRADVAT